MYFVSRLQLGEEIAGKLTDLKGRQPIVLCLNDDSLSTSISLASQLNAWVYPLLSVPVVIPGDPRILGVINQDGELCYNPDLSQYEREELEMEYAGIIQDASRDAFHALNLKGADYGQLNKEGLNGRSIILCGSIVRDSLDIGAATEFLKSIRTPEIISAVGNVDVNIADSLIMMSTRTCFMDVMSNMFDTNHYFEQPETYTPEEQHRIAMNIATFWK